MRVLLLQLTKNTSRISACKQQKMWNPQRRSLMLQDALTSQIWKTAPCVLFLLVVFFVCFSYSWGQQWDTGLKGFPCFPAAFSSLWKCRSESPLLKTRGDSRSVAAATDSMWGELQHRSNEPAFLPLQGCVFWLWYELKALTLPQASYGTRELLHWKVTSPSAPNFLSYLATNKLLAEVWLWIWRGEETLDN